jgi:hypothetical protein
MAAKIAINLSRIGVAIAMGAKRERTTFLL